MTHYSCHNFILSFPARTKIKISPGRIVTAASKNNYIASKNKHMLICQEVKINRQQNKKQSMLHIFFVEFGIKNT